MPRKWLTPSSAATSASITLTIPLSSQQIATLRGLLLDLSNPDKWQQEYGLTPAQAAAEWEQALADFEAAL